MVSLWLYYIVWKILTVILTHCRSCTSNWCVSWSDRMWLCCGVMDGFPVHVWQCNRELQCEIPTCEWQQWPHYSIHIKYQCYTGRFSAQCGIQCVSGGHQFMWRYKSSCNDPSGSTRYFLHVQLLFHILSLCAIICRYMALENYKICVEAKRCASMHMHMVTVYFTVS